MKWSTEAWNAAKPIYEKIVELPFIKGLTDGTLDKEKFTFYIRQDALYLADYGKVLTAIASKLSQPEHIESFIRFAGDSIAVEQALHKTFICQTNTTAQQEMSPSCLLYTSFLLSKVANAPVEVMVAAVLPCFWIYKKVGDHILANQTKEDNPYQSWIDTYGGEEFEKSVARAVAIADDLASRCTLEQREAMTEAYATCSKMEWLFWDSAWRLEKWTI